MINRSIVVMPLLALCMNLHAQQQEAPAAAKTEQRSKEAMVVTGFVSDAATGKGIVGASITYGDVYAAITDTAGKFSVKVPGYNVAVRVNAEGYQTSEIALKGRHNVSAALYESEYPSFYGEVTTPFAVVSKNHLTTAAASVQTHGAWNTNNETPDTYLQGKVAGLNVVRRSGTPNMGANLFLRGFTSLNASSQPLIIVDGLYFDNNSYGSSIISGYYNNPLAYIDTRDIDNITVIKDGSSIYGAKGANGVILVTTARARQEATQIDVALYGGINQAPSNVPVMNAEDYRIYLSEMLQSKGLSYGQAQALPYMNDDPAGPDYHRYHYNNNWQDNVFRNSYVQNGYLKITGGDNIAKYALSMGFLKNDGNVESTSLTRYNTRFNADLNLSKRLTAAANLSFMFNDQMLKDMGTSLKTNPVATALIKAPFLRTYDVNSQGIESPSLADRDTFNISNPAALAFGMQAQNKNYRFTGAVNFNYLLARNLTLGTTVGITMDKVREAFFVPQLGIVPDTLENAIARNRSGVQIIRMFGFNNDTRLAYNKTFNNVHHLSARLGVRYTNTKAEQDKGFGYNSATDQLKGVGFGLNSLRSIGGISSDWAWMSTYVNADYNLSNKYFVSFNMATDGSSRFGKEVAASNAFRMSGYSYGIFPSLSASWLVSSENFMAGNRFIDLLKLRASAGLTGNDDIGDFTARSLYSGQSLLGVSGLARYNISNPALQWEAVTRLNAGLDVALFKERLNLTVDVYENQTDKMLVNVPAPAASGMEYILGNSGAMKTNGWEATVNARVINQKDLKWDVGFNVSQYKSKVTKLPVEAILTDYAGGTYITMVGSAPNLFYGYKAKGVYSTGAEAAADGFMNKNSNGTTTAFGGGDVRFENRNGDNLIDDNDRQVIGDPNPDYFGGVTSRVAYKNWSLDALFSFSQGNDVYNFTRRQLESMSGYANQLESVNNRWKTDGQVTGIPKAAWGDPLGNSRFSGRWIEDGSYFRLRTVSLSYNVPLKSGFVKYATVYVTGNNVFTLTKYLGYDPEFSAAAGVYGQGADALLTPQFRSGQVGVRVGL